MLKGAPNSASSCSQSQTPTKRPGKFSKFAYLISLQKVSVLSKCKLAVTSKLKDYVSVKTPT